MGQVVPLIASYNIEIIGEWHIDYSTSRVRGNGQFGTFFGTTTERMALSVPLSFMDRAYLPEDLEMIKKNRTDKTGISGFRAMHLKLRSVYTDEMQDAYCFKNVVRDHAGAITEARGVLFASSAVTASSNTPRADRRHEDALRHLVEATKAVGQLGFEHLRPMLQVIFREVAQDALLRQLPRP